MAPRAKRIVSAIAFDVLSTVAWAMVSLETLRDNAAWAATTAFALLAVAWAWDDLVAMLRWRFGKRKLWLEMRTARLPRTLAPGADITTLRVLYYNDTVQLSTGGFAHVDSEYPIDYGTADPPMSVRIAVTNYSEEPLAQTILIFDAKLHEANKSEDGGRVVSGEQIADRELSVELDRLADDQNRPTVAYVVNETPYFATLFLKEIRVKPFGGKLGPAVVEGKQFSRSVILSPAERF